MVKLPTSNAVTCTLICVVSLACRVEQSFCQQFPNTKGFYQQQRCLINNAKCSMPDLPVFPVGGFTQYDISKRVSCSNNKGLLTYTTVENNVATLHIREDAIGEYYDRTEDLKCCYAYVERYGTASMPDNGIRISSCEYFNYTVVLQQDTVAVKCFLPYNDPNWNQPITYAYENVHQVIRLTPSILQKSKEMKKTTSQKPISVLFVVIDSVARLNFIRTMPLTHKFITDNGFVEFKGYNKIHDNTFPNFGAWLTGMTQDQMYKECDPQLVGGLDRCPMIWYEFRRHGYVTAYAEDWASIATFNYMKKGFKDPPTDYYFKPYMEAAEHLNIRYLDTMPYCTGPEPDGERVLNLAQDFTKTFKHQPNFGVFWMNTFSHNFINTTTYMDFTMSNFYRNLKTNGILDESIVIFLSDHGVRFGDILSTTRGFFEERLPMNYISLPPWFRRKFPTETFNFLQNSQKLSSTFDLYMTLQHILQLSGTEYRAKRSRACYNCKSLFEAWPVERSCENAGVPEKWCTCLGHFTPINKTEYQIDQLANDLQNAMVEIWKQEYNSGGSISINCNNIISLDKSVARPNDYQNGEVVKYFLIHCQTDIGLTYQILLREKPKPKWLVAGNEVVHVRRIIRIK